jgi:hypothetical protein
MSAGLLHGRYYDYIYISVMPRTFLDDLLTEYSPFSNYIVDIPQGLPAE